MVTMCGLKKIAQGLIVIKMQIIYLISVVFVITDLKLHS